jgi:hypothetical protein
MLVVDMNGSEREEEEGRGKNCSVQFHTLTISPES